MSLAGKKKKKKIKEEPIDPDLSIVKSENDQETGNVCVCDIFECSYCNTTILYKGLYFERPRNSYNGIVIFPEPWFHLLCCDITVFV